MNIEKVGIAGLNNMGIGIAQVLASAGLAVNAWDLEGASIEEAERALSQALEKSVVSGLLKGQDTKNILSNVHFSKELAALKGADLVIESLPEDLDRKKSFFSDISEIVKDHVMLATTTSCFSVTEIALAAKNPERFLGMHFFKPVQSVKLVEVVRAENTSQGLIDLVANFCGMIGKETVVVKDSPGFIVNYLFVPYMNQALEYYDHKLAEKEALDTALRMGLGYPKGPLTLIDEIGLDEHLHLTSVLYERLKDQRFAAPAILQRMVAGGKTGKKAGKGFYSYDRES
jgi:3-hydroxybutyryl-CoA dehydrogenase